MNTMTRGKLYLKMIIRKARIMRNITVRLNPKPIAYGKISTDV